MIEVRALRKSYAEIVAVDDVTFEIRSGETFGLLGPNGAGKTTTIHMMVGALHPDGGTVSIDGAFDPTRRDVRKRIGIAPQKLALYENLSGEENLSFFGRLYGLSGAVLRERVEAGLDFAGLRDRRKHQVHTYSGGMQRRLNLACALVHDPPAIFLDEPTVGVDPQSRNHLFESIERLKRQGRTIVYTTHYMEEAQRLCDRVGIMDRGKLLALDNVSGLIDQFGGRSVVTADFETVPSDVASLPGKLEGRSIRFETNQPLEDVGRLAARGLKFSSLHVDRPDLETVFLSLTGRSLRD
jgi:ABC-2 type transport system ATP-binding protein